ncbi:MAG TPA: hypothetical protein VFW45_04165 [Candidatus Polarisedimenticolia bacterium]|nr:hypothetical protein [Candidatus Polarisedimenticolia bacterium]
MKNPVSRYRLPAGSRRFVPALVAALLLGALPEGAFAGTTKTPAEPISSLWVKPVDLPSRDLFAGPPGPQIASGETFHFKSSDTKGHSDGYDVKDSKGRTWDVKLGDEAQPEVVTSRILWALGYHQPIVRYVSHWRMAGGPTTQPEPGRFRLASDHRTEGEWSWHKNPFVETPAYRGLVLANVILNNWDLDRTNNRVYRSDLWPKGQERRYVVQDVGASLAKTRWPIGTRNDLEDFESQDFVIGVRNGRVEFDFHGNHTDLVRDMKPPDVAWICRLMSRLSDRQLDDAFRAAEYPPEVRARYVRKIREKIAQGLELGDGREARR